MIFSSITILIGKTSFFLWCFRVSALTHHAPAEELDASPKADDERGAERQQYPAKRERLQCLRVNWRDHCITHALGGIGERVEQCHDLKPLDRAERSPGIKGTSSKDQRREH